MNICSLKYMFVYIQFVIIPLPSTEAGVDADYLTNQECYSVTVQLLQELIKCLLILIICTVDGRLFRSWMTIVTLNSVMM